jgi:hypothetical protein
MILNPFRSYPKTYEVYSYILDRLKYDSLGLVAQFHGCLDEKTENMVLQGN